MHYSIVYAYNLLRNFYLFRLYYLAIFRDMIPKFL